MTSKSPDADQPAAESAAAPRSRLRRKIDTVASETAAAAAALPPSLRAAASKYDDVLNTILRIAEGDGKFEHKLRRTEGIIASHAAAARAAHRGKPNVEELVEAERQGMLAHLRQANDSGKLGPGQVELLTAVLAP